ncbi:hypothetical protein RYX36_011785, partial [Vicia faba]
KNVNQNSVMTALLFYKETLHHHFNSVRPSHYFPVYHNNNVIPTFSHFVLLPSPLLQHHHFSTSSSQNDDTFDFVRPIDRKLLDLNKMEKLRHLKFYWHDIMTGKNPTSFTVVPSPSKLNSTFSFGLVTMMDDPLTLGPELSSKLVGKCQGLYASTSQDNFSFLMAMFM